MPQTPYSIQTVRNLPEVRELKNVRCLSSLIWLEKFLDKRNYELIQIDTDSPDLWLSWDSLEEAVFPAMAKEFRACKNERNAQEPGLFMLEFEDICGIALCSKCYFMEEEKRKVKVSPKGSLKRQNKMRWERFKAALEGVVDTASHKRRSENEVAMCTYQQKTLALNAYYDKWWVLPRGHPHGADRISSVKRRQLGVSRRDKKLLANEAPFGAVVQIIQNRFIGFADGFYDVVHFKRPDRICGFFCFRPQARRAGKDSTQPPRRGVMSRTGEKICDEGWRAWNKRPFLWWPQRVFARERVTSPFREETTAGSQTTHSEDLWPSGSRISTALWCHTLFRPHHAPQCRVEEKEGLLGVWRENIEFGERNVFWKIYLPKGLEY